MSREAHSFANGIYLIGRTLATVVGLGLVLAFS